MRFAIVAAILAVFLPFMTSLNAQPKIDMKHVVYINDIIEKDDLKPLGKQLFKWAKSGVKSVDIVINSPGGEVYAGGRFIAAMEAVKAEGTTIRCFVPELAASMAFQIFVHCDERHALNQSWLLFHSVRIFMRPTVMTAALAKALQVDLEATDREIVADLRENMDMLDEHFTWHFEHETLHTARGLTSITDDFMKTAAYYGNLQDVVDGETKDDHILRASDFRPKNLLEMLFGGQLQERSKLPVYYMQPEYINWHR